MFKNFYGGGLGSVRVFEQGSLGSIDPTGAFIGGTRKANVNAQLYFPVPGMGNDKSLRCSPSSTSATSGARTRRVELGQPARLHRCWASAGFRRWAR